jgi:subtilase family serine protease
MYRRTLAITGLVVALLAAAFAVVGPRVHADSGWVNTNTQGLALDSATALGDLPGVQTLHIDVALALRNQASLNQYIHDINDPANALYGQELDPASFTAAYGPTSDQVGAVTGYLGSQGLSNIRVESNNLFVTADGTAAQVQSAFNTHLGLFSQNGMQVYANTTAAQVPSSLGGVVVAVLGLSNAGVMETPTHVAVPTYLNEYSPQGFQLAYDAAGTATGSRTAIAIFAEGDLTQVLKDLRTEEAANHLPQVPVSVVPVGIASPDTAGVDEWDLDTQFSTGMAQTVSRLYLYDTTSLTDSDVALMFNRFAAQKVARAGSASFGLCEVFAYLDGSMLADDEVFAEAAAQGQTVFASAGDTGGFCPAGPAGVNGVPAGAPMVNYPAASTYVVAGGGTSLLTNADGSYNNELAWTAGGGGLSQFDLGGYWQSGVNPATTVGKGVPDLAMDADPNSGANVYINGAPTGVGGTSLSSPLALGVWARIESGHANKIGFAAPHLYGLYQGAGLHDIILGDTGPWPATPGYDYATGIGSFDIAQASKLIK